MPCYHPIEAWRSGQTLPNGKRPLIFSPVGAFGPPIKIPCRGCIGCRLEYRRQWAIRCEHENIFHKKSCFLTLTFNDENRPENGSLSVRPLQLFLKKLRKKLGPKKIRYFACGEYGEKFDRPHYHAIIWGYDFQPTAASLEDGTSASDVATKIWGHGFARVDPFSPERAAYVAGYALKKINGQLAEKHYERIDPDTGEITQRKAEFVTMSRAGGIGHKFFEQFRTDIYPCDFALHKGKKGRVPRYYDNKLSEAELQELKLQRKKQAALNWRDNTTKRLRVREIVATAKSENALKRNLNK
ncbi:MAG: replication initiator protein [Microvirus sp.]|nr:MAG: replication initiator protein [Microvirus sp.]